MAFYIFNTPVDKPASSQSKYVKFGKLNKQDDGTVTFSYDDGSVLSVQPNGDWQQRPSGSNGQYEKATINGITVTFDPNDGAAQPFIYTFFDSRVTS